MVVMGVDIRLCETICEQFLMTPQASISTPAKRRKLPVSKSIYWSAVGGNRAGLKLGYRRGARGGSWVAKVVDDGRRAETTLGVADDYGSAPGALNHSEAIAAALAWAGAKRSRIAGGGAATPDGRSLTVADAARAYIEHRVARNPVTGRDAKSRLGLHVIGDERFASVPLAKLTAEDFVRWRRGLPKALRPATVNRTINDLRAALRAAIDQNWRDLPQTLGKEVEIGLRSLPSAEVARHAMLSDHDTRKAIDAANGVDPDLGALVLVLAATGARFSQVAKIAVADVQADAERIMVPASGKGKGSKGRSRLAVPVGSDVIERLKPLIEGRGGHEPLLMRWVRRQVSPTRWECVARAPWDTASHMQRGWRKALKIAGVAHVEAYALRHSSIVRMLREGLPVRVVAGLHDTSTAMIEKHYSAYILDMADELARRAVIPLTSAPAALLAVG
jgi:integrase